MVRDFSSRRFYRVVFFCSCLIFACSYRGGSGNDKRTIKTEPTKLKENPIDKSLSVEVFFERDERAPNLTVNAEDVTSDDANKKTDFQKIIERNETVVKPLRSERIQKSPELPSSTSSLSKVKCSIKESSTISHGDKNILPSENRKLEQNDLTGTAKRESYASLTPQDRRNRRNVDGVSAYKVDPTACADFAFTVKSEDEYSVWNNFSMKYQRRIYHYNEYRVRDNGVQVCGSSNTIIQQRWSNLILEEKAAMASNHCNASLDGFYPENLTLYRNFTVFFKPTEQNFTSQDYRVISGHFVICSTKLNFSCNNHLVKVRYGEQYSVFNNFSLFYKKKTYNYREYRLTHDYLEICASSDTRVQAIWETRNSWEKFFRVKSCNSNYNHRFNALHYTVNKQLTTYWVANGQYFRRTDYFLKEDTLIVCKEKLGPVIEEYTKSDKVMCNDSIISLEYSDNYKVSDDFSILYKKKVYDYTEYRVLNDSIKICNSTDNFVRSMWKLRNRWLKRRMHLKSCNEPLLLVVVFRGTYTVLKDFRVRLMDDRIITKYDYGVVEEGKLIMCEEKLLVANIKYYIAPLCGMALSFLSLLLLLIVYCMLPVLRTLPGLNLMSLSFAFLLWPTSHLVFFSLHLGEGKLVKLPPCASIVVTSRLVAYSILMNAAVNVYHLRKTFCSNTLVKSDENKWKSFLKYCLFGWGVPIIITIVYTALVLTDVLRFHEVAGWCVGGHDIPFWLMVTEARGLEGCLLLYVIVMFIFTAYRIHQKLKASSNIAQKSHIVRNRKNFVLLLKLSTTSSVTILSYLFDFIGEIHQLHSNFKIRIVLDTLAFLSCVYLAITFVFTRKNYQLFKKKYFPAKNKQINQ